MGAVTGATVSWLNHVMHKVVERSFVKSRLKRLGISDPYASIAESDRVSAINKLLEGDPTLRKLHASVNYHEVKYDKDLLIPGRTAAVGRKIVQLSVGPLAFNSFIGLYQTLGHELVHAFHFYGGAFSAWEKQVGTDAVTFLSEAEAYFWNWKQDSTTNFYWNEGYRNLKKYYETISN